MSLLVVLLILLGVVSLQLMRVQVLVADDYVRYGEQQRLRGIDLVARRGFIYDRNQEPLAMSIPKRTVVADPRAVPDPERTARDLARVLDEDAGELYDRLTEDGAFVYLARQVDDEVADAVEERDLDGIWTIEEPSRMNTGDDLALSVLGGVDTDGEAHSGLELAYDEALSGTPGSLVLERDPEGRTIAAGRRDMVPAEPGDDLVLTIDKRLQYETERVLAEHVAQTRARRGTAILSDPRTGEIYAMVNVDRDPESGQTRSSPVNHALVSTYEPGSVSKVVTLATALEEGVVNPETTMSVPDSITVGDRVFGDVDGHAAETYSVQDILAHSSNVGTIMTAQQVGAQAIYDYLVEFGFGTPTGLDFPDQATGQYPEPDNWSSTSMATIPLGQGIAVTPMEMLLAYNVIANDGVYRSPTLVGGVVDAEGDLQPTSPGESRRVISAETAAQMREMMTHVISEGTGELAAIDGYEVAGKTGTARKPNLEAGGYEWPDGYHYTTTFAGFMPADDPSLSVLVMLDEPEGGYASATAAPAFAELSRHALRLLKLPPTTG